MATTVNQAFAQFNTNIVNLDSDRTKTARSSRDWLMSQLQKLPSKIDDFPILFDHMHVYFGSFARNTKVRPLDDIDMFLAFHAQGSTYLRDWNNQFTLYVPDNVPSLRNLCNDDGTLNSIKLVNKIVSSLGKIEQYRGAERHREGEAATLQLTSYEWNFDIVPALHTDTGHYIIPDGRGGWQGTDPRLDDARVNEIVQKHGKISLQLIRTLKYWNRRASMVTIRPYLFENIILNYLDRQEKISNYVDIILVNFWSDLQAAIHYQVPDPKGFQGDLNTLTWQERTNIAVKAKDAYEKAYTAYDYEINQKDQQAAIAKWREIFGDNFPKYE